MAKPKLSGPARRTLRKMLFGFGGTAFVLVYAAKLLLCPATAYAPTGFDLTSCVVVSQSAINEIMAVLTRYGALAVGGLTVIGIAFRKCVFKWRKDYRAARMTCTISPPAPPLQATRTTTPKARRESRRQ